MHIFNIYELMFSVINMNKIYNWKILIILVYSLLIGVQNRYLLKKNDLMKSDNIYIYHAIFTLSPVDDQRVIIVKMTYNFCNNTIINLLMSLNIKNLIFEHLFGNFTLFETKKSVKKLIFILLLPPMSKPITGTLSVKS